MSVHKLNCPKCGLLGFWKKYVWRDIKPEGHKMKCEKCGEWSMIAEWDAKTEEVERGKKSKLAEILKVVAHAKEYDGSMTCDEATTLIRRAYLAGRESVEQGELLATLWVSEENLGRIGNAEVFDSCLGKCVEVEVRRCK